MRRSFLLAILLCVSCSDGAREGVPRTQPPIVPADEASDRGVANDRGDGTDDGLVDDFATCRSNSDCGGGLCIGKLPDETRFCVVPCGVVAVSEVVTTTCPRGQQCFFEDEDRVGFCARPCDTDGRCPAAELPLECRWSRNLEARVCIPRIKTETTGL